MVAVDEHWYECQVGRNEPLIWSVGRMEAESGRCTEIEHASCRRKLLPSFSPPATHPSVVWRPNPLAHANSFLFFLQTLQRHGSCESATLWSRCVKGDTSINKSDSWSGNSDFWSGSGGGDRWLRLWAGGVKLRRVNVRIVGDDGGEGTLVTSRFRRLGGPAAMRRP
jgi:hypothetical protein